MAVAQGTAATSEETHRTTSHKSKASVVAEPSCAATALRVLTLLFSLYCFIVGLALMGDAFKCLGGRGAGKLFHAVDNPVAGLMVGILATVLVQSSSTSTSIIVGLVGAGQLTVENGIPVIMGANIGTSVTNTIVSMGHAGVRLELERAFSAATVHDMFNLLSVAVLLPIEIIVTTISGEGGLIYWASKELTSAFMGGRGGSAMFESPVKAITAPLTSLILQNNKYVSGSLSFGPPEALITPAGSVIESSCAGLDCSRYYCVAADIQSAWAKVSQSAFDALLLCVDHLADAQSLCMEASESAACYLNAGAFYTTQIEAAEIIKGGILSPLGETTGGLIALFLSLGLLIGGLVLLVQVLHKLMMGRARRIIVRAANLNAYLAMLAGALITLVVQSSSVVTSALTPLAGIGVLTLENMLPLTLGANIGTTCTGMLAALTVLNADAIQIALAHLFFNVFGILIWFPVPPMRQVPLGAARLLGMYASFYRCVPLLYLVVAFLLVPGTVLAVSLLFDMSVVWGTVVTVLLLGVVAVFIVWWTCLGGCYWAISKEQRERRVQEKGWHDVPEQDAGVTVCTNATAAPEAAGGEHAIV